MGTRLAERDELATDVQWTLDRGAERLLPGAGIDAGEVAIGALLASPAVSSVIAGATKPEQVAANARAAAWSPSEADMAALASLLGAPA